MARFLTLVDGVQKWVQAIAASVGITDADKIVATGSNGTIHPSLQGTGYSSIPVGMEGYYFASATGAYANRTMIVLPEQTTLPVSPPSADQIKLYAADESGYPALNYLINGGFQFRIGSDSYRFVRNNTGSTLTKGTIVYYTGSFPGSSIIPTVAKACAAYQATAITVPAVGAIALDIPNNSIGIILTTGKLENIDTASSGVAEGSVAVLGMTPGTFQASAPPLPNETQRVGIVLKSHATSGVLLVDPRTIITRSFGTNKNSFSVGDAQNTTKSLIFLGTHKTTLNSSPTADRIVVLPDASGTLMDATSYSRLTPIQAGFAAAANGSALRKSADGSTIEYAVPRCRILHRWIGTESITGTTSEVNFVNGAYTIAANTLSASSTLEIYALFSMTNSANSKTPRVKIGTATVYSNAFSAVTSLSIVRHVFLSSLTSQVSPAQTLPAPGQSGGAIQDLTIDFGAAQVVQISGQLANTGENITLRLLEIRDVRP